MTSQLLHELSRRKENESRGETSALLAKQSRSVASGSSTDKVCFYCGKKSHIAKFCFKRKNNEKESANNTKVHDHGDEYAFMSDEVDEYAMMASNVSCNASVSDGIVDSGATSHMAPVRNCFQSYNLISPKNVILGDDTVLQAIGRGTVVVDTEVKGRVKTITIKDVLHVPKLNGNLLSVRHLVLTCLPVKFSNEGSFVLSPS